MVHFSDYKVSLSMIKDSLKRRSKEFFRENSTHVVPYYVDPFRSISERIMWFIIFNICAAAGITTIITIWQKFQTSPTLTFLNVESENMTVDFPSVYLCFDQAHLNLEKLKSNQKKVLKSIYHWKESSLDLINEQVDIAGLQEFYLKVSPECGEFFSNCEFRKNSFNCGDLLTHKTATPRGICCVLASKSIKKDDPSWSLRFRSHQFPISLYLMGKFEGSPIYGQQPNYILTDHSVIELSIRITTTASNVRFLRRSQRKCVFPEESTSHVECERENIKSMFKEKCNCLPWFHTNNQIEECSLSGYKCLFRISVDQIKFDKCYISCNHAAYISEKPEYSLFEMNNLSEIKLLKWPAVRFRRVTRFGWLDLIVSFGGVAGFFIGLSSITMFEVFYYFALRTYCGAVLSKPKTRFNIQVQSLKPIAKPAIKYPNFVRRRCIKNNS